METPITLLSHPTKGDPRGRGQFLIACDISKSIYMTAWENFENGLISNLEEFPTLPDAFVDYWTQIAKCKYSAPMRVTMEWFDGEQLPLIKVEDITHGLTNSIH